MANKKITDLPTLTNLSDDDWFYVVDVSDLTESDEGTSKKVKQLSKKNYIHDFTSLLDQQEFLIPSNYTLGSVFLNRTFLIQSEYTFTNGILTILETLETGTIISTR